MSARRHLVLGGVKSGKSRYALRLAEEHVAAQEASGDVVFIATARVDDKEMAQRIERHRLDRPAHWRIIEEPRDVSAVLKTLTAEWRARNDAEASDSVKNDSRPPVVLVDCLTLWLTQLSCEPMSDDDIAEECRVLVHRVSEVDFPIILVSNELNMGVTPLGKLSRRYCDAAGLLHQSLAAVCDSVTLVVAGLPLHLKAAQD